jgi:hypothetical protein
MDRREIIAAELETQARGAIAFFMSLPDDALARQVYADGAQWSVRQVVAHLITIERSMHVLFRDILAGGTGGSEHFDVDRFNRTQPRKLDGLSRAELVERFRAVRADTVAIVRGMTEEDLDREGVHPYHGRGRLERFVRWAYEHARLHEADIRGVTS